MNYDKLPASVTSNELNEVGVKLRADNKPESRNYDLLERFRATPNHALFLYTSEDVLLEQYILKHWSALDGLSGDICDIYISLMQLLGEEDVYSQFDEIKSIPGLATIVPTELPALHIWSNSASLKVLLGTFQSEEVLRYILRLIFAELRSNGSPLSFSQAESLSQKISIYLASQSAHRVDPSKVIYVYPGGHYYDSNGGAFIAGDVNTGGDFTGRDTL